ncbi:predicted protein [Naegleria gruberi]|uniref:Predicted protein n=1 Tax=Naegleria gruberi TaxID=5762 RepID=D2VYF7_NAEGR|nr:uncharacterized protein NAEGRDRAFT_59589 [Naegleria gruberi]EFC38050.1 predicted protein [Naegleria gruberi]|eukprot:XP_002670794.1 predicted protein [Naegleria gruberi strain NEG-M]
MKILFGLLCLSCFLFEYSMENWNNKVIKSYIAFNSLERKRLEEMNFELFDTRKLIPDIMEQVMKTIRERMTLRNIDELDSEEEKTQNGWVNRLENWLFNGHDNWWSSISLGYVIIPRSVVLTAGTLLFPLALCFTPLHILTYPLGFILNVAMEHVVSEEENTKDRDQFQMNWKMQTLEVIADLGHLYSIITRIPQTFCEQVVNNWQVPQHEWKEKEDYLFLKMAYSNQENELLSQEEIHSVNTLIGDLEFYDQSQKYCTRYDWVTQSPLYINNSTERAFGHSYNLWAALALSKSAILWLCNSDCEIRVDKDKIEENKKQRKRRIQVALENFEKANKIFAFILENPSKSLTIESSKVKELKSKIEENIKIANFELEKLE